MTYRSLFLPEIFYNLGAEESSVQNALFHHECDFSNSNVLAKHFFPKSCFFQITLEDACLIPCPCSTKVLNALLFKVL